MGKKGGVPHKGKKINSVFKVAGARSLKIKNKAKPVAAQLKKLKGDGREAVNEMNRVFSNLQNQVRQQGATSAAAAARQAEVIAELRQADVERKKKASQRQKIQEEIDGLSELLIS